ncbi:hypothetical protein ACLQ28_21130 [Micromonospora sp. DT201]|uniref:hypothetical protein n=1 Tax=Micromonospora sp. DT201 TaxID=3393442 RepID=UPI003CFB11DC
MDFTAQGRVGEVVGDERCPDGAAGWRSDKPSTTGYYYNSQLTAGSGNYHDDNYGSFFAAGYSLLFYAPTIHTGRWNQCNVSPGCRYYQVPWA